MKKLSTPFSMICLLLIMTKSYALPDKAVEGGECDTIILDSSVSGNSSLENQIRLNNMGYSTDVAARMVLNNEPVLPVLLSEAGSIERPDAQDIVDYKTYRSYSLATQPRLMGKKSMTVFRGVKIKNGLSDYDPVSYKRSAWRRNPDYLDAKEVLMYVTGDREYAQEYATGTYSSSNVGIVVELNLPRSLVYWRSEDEMYMFDYRSEGFVYLPQIKFEESFIHKIHYTDTKNNVQRSFNYAEWLEFSK